MRYLLTILSILCLALPAGAASELLSLKTSVGTLSGVLELPEVPSNRAVLIIGGSGPVDRDGNVPGVRNDALKKLAQGLARVGIPSLRYDKRSLAPGLDESEARFAHLVEDAVAWGKLLTEKGYKDLVILGHSQGALVGALAYWDLDARGLVSVAGAGRPLDEVLLVQLEKNLSPNLFNQSRSIIQRLKRGKSVGSIPQPLQVLFRRSVQPFLISWMAVDPVATFKELLCPVLVVQGTLDLQVGMMDAVALSGANPRGKLYLVPGMNHVLRDVSADPQAQMKSYTDPSLPLAPGLVDTVAGFIKEL